MQSFELKIKEHKFNIETIHIKANEKFRLKVINEDSSSEEFESRTIVIEKFIGPKRTVNLILGPLKPGKYEFFGDFHADTAKGFIIAE